MLMTAGLFTGGWLVLAWVRTLLDQRRADYIGYFKFVDPLYIWHGDGRGVWVTLIEDIRKLSVRPQYSPQGVPTGATVRIKVKGDSVDLDLKSLAKADEVADFLDSVPQDKDLSPADQGFYALYTIDHDGEELRRARAYSVEEDRSIQGVAELVEDRAVEKIPDPEKARMGMTWWRYPVVVAAMVALFVVCRWICKAQHDHAVYDLVRNDKAGMLRAYLVDPRNTRHREEIQQRVNQVHDAAAQRILQRGRDHNLKNGLAAIVLELKPNPRPIVAIGFKQSHTTEGNVADGGAFSPTMVKLRHEALQKNLCDHLTNVVGEDVVAYGAVPDGEPAMIEISYAVTLKPNPPGVFAQGICEVDWTVTVSTDPDSTRKYVYCTRTTQNVAWNVHNQLLLINGEFVNRIKQELPYP
jgi:hypothetical protein